MSRQEILSMPIGEMYDMIACSSIYEGTAKQKSGKKWLKMEDFLTWK